MYIEKISIASFGTLKNKEYTLSNGLNIIEGNNESGKTTLMNFVLFVLYGTDSALNKRIKSSGEAFSGKITLYSDKLGKITVSRTASAIGAKSSDKVTVTSCDTLREINIGKSAPGDYILGVNREFFENSVFVSQSGASKYDASSASSAVQNILNSANEKMSTEKGKKKLDETRKNLKHKNGKGGVIYTVSSELSLLEAELEGNKNGRVILKEAESRIQRLQNEGQALDAIPQLIANEKSARCAKKLHELMTQYTNLENTEKFKKESLDALMKVNEAYKVSNTLSELRRLDVEAKLTKARVDVLSSSLKLAQEQYDSMEKKQNLIPESFDAYAESIQKMCYSSKKFLYIATSGFVVSAITIILCIMCIAYSEIVAAAALILCALISLVGGFLFLSYRKSKKAEITKELIRYAFNADATLREIKDEAARRREFETIKQDKKDEIEQIGEKKSSEYNLYAKKIEQIKALLAETVDDASELSLDEQLQYAESKINQSYEAETSLKQELSEISYRKSILAEEIRRYDMYSEIQSLPDPEFSEYSDSALDEHLHSVIKRKDAITAEIQQLSVQITALENRLRPEDDIEAEILEKRNLLKVREEQFEIVSLAQEALDKASNNIRSAVTPNIIKICDKLFSEITCGRYDHVGLDSTLSLNGVSGDESRAESELSYGTNEAMYLAFRLSLCTVLCQNEIPPLMLDESLAHIDDNRSTVMMKMLSELNAQSILFTCGKRESSLAKESGLDPNILTL